jgi:hypothetical protein
MQAQPIPSRDVPRRAALGACLEASMCTTPRRDGERAVQHPLPSMAEFLNWPAHLAV